MKIEEIQKRVNEIKEYEGRWLAEPHILEDELREDFIKFISEGKSWVNLQEMARLILSTSDMDIKRMYE